ncbi:mitochondrial thiamine pyrophosphate carrier-like isoform X2 [Liolophura sinensis]|uniref:mitochondrial thiamine pyrophosphate carrier-like isoform X2 n=1 Tax=Liolophura sinensis TaxID=3198878 RepID=UPI00315867CD
MVGYDPSQSVQLSQTEILLAGGLSGAASRAVGQPLDVLKIRFQIEPIKRLHVSKYQGLYQATGRIIREEGLRALWKGHVPAQFLSILYGLSQFGLFELITKQSCDYFPSAYSTVYLPVTHFVCGAMSSSLTTLIVQPLDVLRTRFVAQGEPKVYTGMVSAALMIRRQEGLTAFYRGSVPALSTVAPQMGLQFGSYALFTATWKNTFGRSTSNRPGAVESMICGSGAGVASKLVVYPMDLVKKRLQVQGFEAARVSFGEVRSYRGMVHCLLMTLREEGLKGIYKGLTPSLLKAATVAGVHLSVYEQVCNLFITWKH